jgi:transposase
MSTAPEQSTPTPASSQSTDPVEVARRLLSDGRHDDVIALISKLLASHERQLRAAAGKASFENEGVTSEQLAIAFSKLPGPKAADEKLDEIVPPPPPDGGKKHGPKQRGPRRRATPEALPVKDNLIVVADDARACPGCGRERTCVRHETTRIIDIKPAEVFVREDRRQVLTCVPCGGNTITAPLGDKVVAGGAYSSNIVAQLLVGKYEDGLPLHRQQAQFRRLGLDIPSATMGDQIRWGAELLKPIANALLADIIASETMHVDGTSLPVLDRDDPKGIKTGSLWGYIGVDVRVVDGEAHRQQRAAYVYTPTGHAKSRSSVPTDLGPDEVLNLRRKTGRKNVVADAAGLFDAQFKLGGLLEVGCNMHGRRYFTKALDAKDIRAVRAINAYKVLYDIEEKLRGKPPDEVEAVRQKESKPVLEALFAWAETYRETELPKSSLGRAVRYLLNHRKAFSRFLDDGVLPIDNGIVERAHRRPAIGRRAYLFAGSDEGARRAAIAYTVLGTCRLNGINPTEYLADVLPKLARTLSITRDLPALMPLAWKQARTVAASVGQSAA